MSYEPGLPCLSAIDPIPFSAIRPSIVIPFPPRLLHHIASFDLHTHSGEESQRLRTGIIDKPLQPSLYFKPRVASLATARVRVAPYSLSTIEWKWLTACTYEPEYSQPPGLQPSTNQPSYATAKRLSPKLLTCPIHYHTYARPPCQTRHWTRR
jgi:hypothetical protein